MMRLIEEDKNKTPSLLFSVRFLTSILVFFGYCFQYMLKINMSIAIVCMVNNTAISSYISHSNSTHLTPVEQQCILANSKNSTKFKHDGPFAYTKDIQGMILASYFYGYITTQILGGWFALKFGGRKVLIISMLAASVLTIVTPFCARWNYIALVVVRILIGVAHGVFWPAVSYIWSFWAPPKERSRLVGLASAGSWLGNIIALPFGGYLCLNGFDGGWASIFYIFGAASVVWCVLFLFLTADCPEEHRFITEREKSYIIEETKKLKIQANQKTPWLSIFLSKCCIAIFVIHFCSNWVIYLFLTQLPTFLSEVLYFDIKSNSLISALPYMASCVVTFITSLVSDRIIHSGKLSLKNVRRLFVTIAMLVPIGAMLGLAFVTCEKSGLAIALLIVGISFTSVLWSAGFLVNVNDVAGPYSGIVFGISNTFATITGIVSPYAVGVLTKNKTQKEWQVVFIISVIVYFIGGTFYVIFCEGKTQHWAMSTRKELNSKVESIDDIKSETDVKNDAVYRF